MGKPETLEEIYEEFGGFGRFQLRALFTILFPGLAAGMSDLLPVFTGARPAEWFCTDINGTMVNVTDAWEALCKCNGTLTGTEGTIVSEWQLVCGSEWVPDFLSSFQMFGMVAGDLLAAYLSDRVGRKNALSISSSTLLLGNLVSAVAPNPHVYAAGRFIVGAGACSIIFMITIYPLEFMTPKWRTLSGPAIAPVGEGAMILALFAYVSRSWRILTVLTCMPLAISFFFEPFLPESPRWLLLQARTEEAKQVLRRMAKCNGVRVEEKIIDGHNLLGNLGDLIQPENKNNISASMSVVELMKSCETMLKTLVFMWCWLAVDLIYYGIGFNVKNLSGDPYFVSRCMGRKAMFMSCMAAISLLMLGAAVLLELGILDAATWLVMGLVFIAKMFAAASMAIIDCFTCESFPTATRSTAVGLANIGGSLGCILGPQMAFWGTYSRTGPYYLFALVALLSMVSAYFVKETNGKPINED